MKCSDKWLKQQINQLYATVIRDSKGHEEVLIIRREVLGLLDEREAELRELLFDREHLTECASCKVGIFCNVVTIGKMILGLTKEETTALIKEKMGDKYPFKKEVLG